MHTKKNNGLKSKPVEHQKAQESVEKFGHLVLLFGVCYLENFELVSLVVQIPIHLILQMCPSYHTLTKAFEMSKKQFSNIRRRITINWCTYFVDYGEKLNSHESYAWQPHWFSQSKLFSCRYSNIKLNKIILRFFPRIGNKKPSL